MSSLPQIEENAAPSRLTFDVIYSLLTTVWMEQACWRPADRPIVLEKLLRDYDQPADEASPKGYRGRNYKLRLEAACTVLEDAFASGIPDSVPELIFRNFPPLDRAHREQLAQLLIAAAPTGVARHE